MAGSNILLADGSETAVKIVEKAFESEDLTLTTAPDYESAKKVVKETHPDLILTALALPDKGGYSLCEIVKSDPELAKIPVILMVGSDETLDKGEANKVGADDYIVRPFKASELVAKVVGLLTAGVGASGGSQPDAPAADLELPDLAFESEESIAPAAQAEEVGEEDISFSPDAVKSPAEAALEAAVLEEEAAADPLEPVAMEPEPEPESEPEAPPESSTASEGIVEVSKDKIEEFIVNAAREQIEGQTKELFPKLAEEQIKDFAADMVQKAAEDNVKEIASYTLMKVAEEKIKELAPDIIKEAAVAAASDEVASALKQAAEEAVGKSLEVALRNAAEEAVGEKAQEVIEKVASDAVAEIAPRLIEKLTEEFISSKLKEAFGKE